MAKIKTSSERHFDYEEWDVGILLATILQLKEWSSDDFSAPYWRIYHNAQEGAFIKSGKETISLKPDYLYVIPPNTAFSAWLAKPVTHFFIHFTVGCGFENHGSIHAIQISPDIKKALSIERGNTSGIQNAFRLYSLVYLILSKLRGWNECRYLPQVGKAIALMKANMRLPLSNTYLGKEVSLHPNSFINLFRKDTGVSPQLFYTQLRVDESCRLLHHTAMSIDDVAAATGFCDRYHFSRVFKKVRRVSPAAFRRNSIMG